MPVATQLSWMYWHCAKGKVQAAGGAPCLLPSSIVEGVMLVTALGTRPELIGAVTHTWCTFTGTLNDTFKWH